MNCFYFDGYSSYPKEGLLTIQDSWLLLRYVTESGEGKELRWKAKEVELEKVSGSEVHIKHKGSSMAHAVIQGFDNKERIIQWHKGTADSLAKLPVGLRIFMYFMLFLLLVLSIYFFVLPWVAQKVVNHIPPDTEVEIGAKLRDVLVDHSVVKTETSKQVQIFLETIYENEIYPIEVYVLKDEGYNAFALPGGYIFIYSALLEELEKSEELAALLGHEISHVTQRHSLNTLAKNFTDFILISSITGTFSTGDLAIAQVQQLIHLSNSRKMEYEADREGYKLICKAGYKKSGFISLFDRLQELSPHYDLEFLSTHPLNKGRINRIKKMEECAFEEESKNYNLKLNSDSLFVLIKDLNSEEMKDSTNALKMQFDFSED